MRERYTLQFKMQAENEDAEVMIYSSIASDTFWGDETTPQEFDKALKDARKSGAKRLNIRINSPGGEVYSAVAMRSMVINAGFDAVRVMIEGLCASAATLFATIPDAHVVIAEGSEFMIHNPMTIAIGSAEEMERTADHLHRMEEQFHEMYAKKTGRSETEIKDWMDAETWFTAKEAVENGFADELLEAEPIAASITTRDMRVMMDIYKAIPTAIAVRDEEISNGVPDAGTPTEINDEEETVSMDIKDITQEQLLAENPALVEEIQQAALTAERQRLEDIDAITPPVAEYQAMAEEAKRNGTSFTDYQKALVAAQKQKAAEHLEARQRETAPAKNVTGGAAEESNKNDEDEIRKAAEDVARFAMNYRGTADGGMY